MKTIITIPILFLILTAAVASAATATIGARDLGADG